LYGGQNTGKKGVPVNRRTIFSLLALIAILQWPSALHAQASCQPVLDALTKVVSTPSHSYSTQTSEGRQTVSEVIYTQGKLFVRMNGKWRQIPEDPKKVLEQMAEDLKHATTTCQIVREESVNGLPATIYSVHSKTEDATGQGQMWIAKGQGLLLREEMDLDVGGGENGKSHRSTRYEYGNIQPPM
jgi:hypothetical protein